MNPFKKTTKLLSLFITAGYPKIDSLFTIIPELEKHSVDFIEVGIPFSDPLADGEIIQSSSKKAISNGMHLKLLFEQLSTIKSRLPIVLMGYLNPILKFGLSSFLEECRYVNINHIIIPDLTPEIYELHYRGEFQKNCITPIFIITTKTSATRIRYIESLSPNGFLYLVSSDSTTGSNLNIDDHQLQSFNHVCTLRKKLPVLVGFGIQSKAEIMSIQKHVDGVIIGSAFIRSIDQGNMLKYLSSIS